MAGKYVNVFSAAPRVLGSRLYIVVFYLGLVTTGAARGGQRQIPFLKPHLVTVTDTMPTSSRPKYDDVNVFPKDITPWSDNDSNPGPSAPDPDSLTTRSNFENEKSFKPVTCSC